MHPQTVLRGGRVQQSREEVTYSYHPHLCVTGGWPSEDVGGQVENGVPLGSGDSSEE